MLKLNGSIQYCGIIMDTIFTKNYPLSLISSDCPLYVPTLFARNMSLITTEESFLKKLLCPLFVCPLLVCSIVRLNTCDRHINKINYLWLVILINDSFPSFTFWRKMFCQNICKKKVKNFVKFGKMVWSEVTLRGCRGDFGTRSHLKIVALLARHKREKFLRDFLSFRLRHLTFGVYILKFLYLIELSKARNEWRWRNKGKNRPDWLIWRCYNSRFYHFPAQESYYN